ncbi:MAG: DUF4270 family protein [Bacteroidota bacterium]
MFRLRSFGIILSILFFVIACTKIDTTRLGSDLIPVVDNVNTFDTLLDVTSRNLLFDDSTRLSKSEYHAVGAITGDPLFGSVKGDIYMEMMPAIFPSAFAVDSLVGGDAGIDSIVLSLRYEGNYGDSAGTNPITFTVHKITDPIPMHPDTLGSFPSVYNLKQNFVTGSELGSKSYTRIKNISDSVSVRRDTTKYKVANQVRIVLDKTDAGLIKALRDTKALKTDTLFRSFFKGFKVSSTVGGNGAMAYISLSDTSTRLEYYIRKKNGTGKVDTTSVAFFCGSNAGHANNIVRNVAGSEMAANSLSDSLLYICTNPGSYGRIKIPGLAGVSNRIVHRAELKIIQIPDPLSVPDKLRPPSYLYLDRFDTAVDRVKWTPIPFDLNPGANPVFPTTNTSYPCFPSEAGIDYSYFGGISPVTKTINGQPALVYTFNLTRYVQSVVTKHAPVLDLRLSSILFAEYFDCTGVQYIPVTGNRVVEGRIKLGGGAARNSPFPYKMQLRIIYSKL